MPDYVKISELPAASSTAGTDQMELNQGGTSRRANLDQVLLQTVNTTTGAVSTTTTTIPGDDTIPQITEGAEFMTLAITPKRADSKLEITVVIHCAITLAASNIVAALFRDSTANAIAVGWSGSYGQGVQIKFTAIVNSVAASASTFRVRAGSTDAGTMTVNGLAAGRLWGGALASSITIREFI